MNYRHAFHAGSFADVFKHAVLTRILLYLCEKPAAFRVIDTHAGAGLYDLTGDESRRGGEWEEGIGKLVAATLPRDADPQAYSLEEAIALIAAKAGKPSGKKKAAARKAPAKKDATKKPAAKKAAAKKSRKPAAEAST